MSRLFCPACGSSTALGDVHCFKCGYKNSVYRITPGFFTDELVQKTRSTVVNLRDDIELNPNKFSPKALYWLYKSCIYNNIITEQYIGYCKNIGKVIVPAFDSAQNLKFFQLRALNSNDPIKYTTYGSTRQYSIMYTDHPESDTIIICEDHLSAMRLRPFNNVLCLSGTSLSWDVSQSLIRKYKKVIFWLDPDIPGRKAYDKNSGLLKYLSGRYYIKSMFTGNIDVTPLSIKVVGYKDNQADPKAYLDNEIRLILQKVQ